MINLASAEQAESVHDCASHHHHQHPHDLLSHALAKPGYRPPQHAQEGARNQHEPMLEVDDSPTATMEAAGRGEAVRVAATRETTPDDEGSSSQMCNVCLCPIRQLIIVLQPCGHYYCEKCTAAIRAVAYPRCPECRTRISSTFRVPLSSAQTHTLKEDAQHAQVSTLQHTDLSSVCFMCAVSSRAALGVAAQSVH